jgi:excisionase family DNA binding protein
MENITFTQITIEDLKEALKEVIKSEIKNLPDTPIREEIAKYASRKEVAAALHISLPTLYELTKTGILTGYKIRGRVLFKWLEIDQALTRIETIKFKRGQ